MRGVAAAPFAAAALLLAVTAAGAAGLRVTLGPRIVVPAGTGVPNQQFFPDGHIAILPEPGGAVFQMYWAGSATYRTLTDQESFLTLAPTTPVIEAGAPGSFDNNGAWLYSVFRRESDELIGFYHAEDTEWPGDPGEHFIAWKSAALATSSDNGFSWTKLGQILTTSAVKPADPDWGGNGDFSVVWEAANARWVMLYTDSSAPVADIKVAMSTDPAARPGSWLKWRDGGFTEAGLGGEGSPLPGPGSYWGGNPSVHYNTHLDRWIMVYHSWSIPPSPDSLWLATSSDLVHWDAPQLLLASGPGERLWFSTIVGESDQVAGRDATLAYAFFPNKNDMSVRQFVTQTIRIDECAATDDPACDDGDPCTVDSCSDGACASRAAPSTACRAPTPLASSRVVLRNELSRVRSLLWRSAQAGVTSLADLGDPRVDTSYTLCAYDQTSGPEPDSALLARATVAGGSCPGCWKALGGAQPRGYLYRDRSGSSDGLAQIALRLGTDGHARIRIRAGGSDLALRSPLTAQAPLVLQLHASNGQCWAASYATLTRNRPDRVEAKGPPESGDSPP